MDHDRLFKELLTNFFFEFLELFFPEIARLIDHRQAPVFLDKELFGEKDADRRRELDLVARVKLATGDAHFLVHLEPQAQKVDDFPEKMFRYFAKLWDRHGLRVYPIAVFAFNTPRALQETQLGMRFPGLDVLDFRFSAVQLNRLEWKAFLEKPNPVASALMARMNFTRAERPRVKLQCLRLLATLRLDPDKSALISKFVDSYLKLEAEEVRIFEQILETIPEMEKNEIMEITTSWQRQGRIEGRVEGRMEGRVEGLRSGLASGLRALFGERARALIERMQSYDLEALQRLELRFVPGARLEDLEAN